MAAPGIMKEAAVSIAQGRATKGTTLNTSIEMNVVGSVQGSWSGKKLMGIRTHSIKTMGEITFSIAQPFQRQENAHNLLYKIPRLL